MNGVPYAADRFATGGSPRLVSDAIAGAPNVGVFSSERYGSYSYEIPVTNDSYDLVLHFAETFQTEPAKRLFNVVVEGRSVLSNYDLVVDVGALTAVSMDVDAVAVNDGYLTVTLQTVEDNATISGLAVYSATGQFVPPPPEPPVVIDLPDSSPATEENRGSDCVVAGLVPATELSAYPNLPDPFTALDGSRLANKSEWRCRRQEILRQAEAYIYGVKPAKPETVSGTVTASSITVNVAEGGHSGSFRVGVELPSNGQPPYPVLFSYGSGFLGFSQNAVVKSEGVAIVSFNPYDLGAESSGGGSRTNKRGVFYDLYGADSDTGLLLAWAWGISRIIDVIEQSDGSILDAGATAVAGCSRFGKGALAAGAFDQRIALTIPFESGSAGVPIWRGIPGEGAQSPGSAYGEQYWLGDGFAGFASNTGVRRLPLDMHEVLALVAPRGLLVLDNPHIANLGPRSAHVAALGAAEVYKALGAEANISYHSNVADGSHCAARPEHVQPLRDNIAKFLLQTGNVSGAINAAAKAQGQLSTWVDWTTPTLADDE